MLDVVAPPPLTFHSCVVQAQQAVCVEAFGLHPAIECLCGRIVGRLAGTAEVQHHIMLTGL